MSIIVVNAGRRKAVVGADTAMGRVGPDGDYTMETATQCSKLFVIPHMRAAAVGRGAPGVLLSAANALMLGTMGSDVAEVGEDLAEHLQDAREEAEVHLSRSGVTIASTTARDAALTVNFVLVGWSRRDQQIVGWYNDGQHGIWGQRFERGPLAYCDEKLLPKFAEMPPNAATAGKMLRASYPNLAAWAQAEGVEPEAIGIGGETTIAEIGPGGIKVSPGPFLGGQEEAA